jgi:hypothetical protein
VQRISDLLTILIGTSEEMPDESVPMPSRGGKVSNPKNGNVGKNGNDGK